VSEQRSPRFRSVLDDYVAYKPGKVARSPEGRSFKLSSNESPYGPLPSVREVISEAGGLINRYPDNGCVALIDAIAGRFGVPPEHVAVGCGSVGVAQMLLEAVGEPGVEVVYAWRSFEAYTTLADLAGVTSVRVPLAEETHDLRAMADAISDRTRLIFVCNPNNPTGTVVRRAELERFLDRVPGDVLVVLDEAYREFVTDPEVPDGLRLVKERDNLALVRTFSKAYGLAGARVGYSVAPPQVAAGMRKVAIPFSVSRLAQAAALASLEVADELVARCAAVVAERDRVHAELLALGYDVPPSQGNFHWLPLGERTAAFNQHCLDLKVLIRAFASDGARVTVGLPEENDAFLAAARTFER
jgi:histidinol-phosphate aminotransferase